MSLKDLIRSLEVNRYSPRPGNTVNLTDRKCRMMRGKYDLQIVIVPRDGKEEEGQIFFTLRKDNALGDVKAVYANVFPYRPKGQWSVFFLQVLYEAMERVFDYELATPANSQHLQLD